MLLPRAQNTGVLPAVWSSHSVAGDHNKNASLHWLSLSWAQQSNNRETRTNPPSSECSRSDREWPIRGQYPGHVITLHQSEVRQSCCYWVWMWVWLPRGESDTHMLAFDCLMMCDGSPGLINCYDDGDVIDRSRDTSYQPRWQGR